MTDNQLFSSKINCCGCGACSTTCPRSAIKMTPDGNGYIYPHIDGEKCIDCGLCKKSCNYQTKAEKKKTLNVYAAATKNTDILKSASGGVFASISKTIISMGGVVFGSSLELIDGKLTPIHNKANNEDDLQKLLGSKYVQSNAYGCFSEIKALLDQGKLVLFSGTPCQVDGLYSYLKKDYENLFTIDIICHGVPSVKLFNDYISQLEKKLGGKVVDFKFRTKELGWSITGKAIYKTKNNKKKEKLISCFESSYMSLFLKGETYRENCYSCKYAKTNRIANITIGDYWGIENVHPEYLKENGGFIDRKKGSSCLIVNDHQGECLFDLASAGLEYQPSSFEKASKFNDQLTTPSKRGVNRDAYLSAYSKNGYKGVERLFKKLKKTEIIIEKLKLKVKLILKKVGLYG